MARLTLWTVQHESAVRRLEQTGVLKADGRRAERWYSDAYQWMRDQMRFRIGRAPLGISYPLWAWKVWKPDRLRPDLRATGHLKSGTPGALLEFTCPADQVLLSDFDSWHCVLNETYLAPDEHEFETFYSAAESDPAKVRESWNRIFDLNFGDPEFWGPVDERRVQATLWQIKREQVRSVQWFRAR